MNVAVDTIYSEVKRLAESRKPARFNPKEHKDKIRSRIAYTFTVAYFFLIAVTLIGVPVYNYWVVHVEPELILNVKDVLLVISGVISGPFGFVLGYYFKGSEKE